MKEVEVGDTVIVRKTMDVPFPGISGDVEFEGVVEKIVGDILTIDTGFNNVATARKKHIWKLTKKAEVKQ